MQSWNYSARIILKKEVRVEGKTRIRTGQGRVEYLAHKITINELLSQGYTLMSIHEQLTGDGKITMSYKTLSGILRGNRVYKSCELKGDRMEILPTQHEGTYSQNIQNQSSDNADRPKGPKMIGASTNTFIQSSNNFSRELETNSNTIEKEDKN